MSKKRGFGLAAVAVVALFLVAGIAYWALRENSQIAAPSGSAGAPPVAPQATAPPPPPASQSASTAPPSQATGPVSAVPAAPSSPTGVAQSDQPVASLPAAPPTPSTSPAKAAQAQPSAPSPAQLAAPTTTLPAEEQMSEADRRQIQKMLQGMSYYKGPINGKFGPLTRAAIRRYQDSIGAKSTGHLTAEEATRLASTR